MKKLLGILVLGLLWCNVGFAISWVKGSATTENTFYFDPDSIVKDGKFTYVWILMDSQKINEDGERSSLFHMKINCKTLQFAMMQIHSYAKQMGKGNPLYSDNNPKENPALKSAPPGSAYHNTFKYVCMYK